MPDIGYYTLPVILSTLEHRRWGSSARAGVVAAGAASAGSPSRLSEPISVDAGFVAHRTTISPSAGTDHFPAEQCQLNGSAHHGLAPATRRRHHSAESAVHDQRPAPGSPDVRSHDQRQACAHPSRHQDSEQPRDYSDLPRLPPYSK